MCVTGSLCCTVEIDRTRYTNYNGKNKDYYKKKKKMIFGSQKNCINSTEFLYIFHLSSNNVDILHNHSKYNDQHEEMNTGIIPLTKL